MWRTIGCHKDDTGQSFIVSIENGSLEFWVNFVYVATILDIKYQVSITEIIGDYGFMKQFTAFSGTLLYDNRFL